MEAVIPLERDHPANRENNGCHGGWPIGFDAKDDKNRTVAESAFYKLKSWRGLAIRG